MEEVEEWKGGRVAEMEGWKSGRDGRVFKNQRLVLTGWFFSDIILSENSIGWTQIKQISSI